MKMYSVQTEYNRKIEWHGVKAKNEDAAINKLLKTKKYTILDIEEMGR